MRTWSVLLDVLLRAIGSRIASDHADSDNSPPLNPNIQPDDTVPCVTGFVCGSFALTG